MKLKTTNKTMGVTHAALQVKAIGAADGLAEGKFTAYASVFGNVDSYGDIVEPGAFTDTLTEWKASGDPIPLLWGHDMHNPYHNLGSVDPATAKEDDTGLLVEGTIDLTNPAGEQVYKMLKGRRVTDMSFAYTVHEERKSADGNHLLKLGLIEVSVVPIGANPATDVLDVKARLSDLAVKAGRVLSNANEQALQTALDQVMDGVRGIESVLAAAVVEPGTSRDDDAAPKAAPEGATVAPEGANQAPANDDDDSDASDAQAREPRPNPGADGHRDGKAANLLPDGVNAVDSLLLHIF